MYKFDKYICKFFIEVIKKRYIPYQRVFERASQVSAFNNTFYLISPCAKRNVQSHGKSAVIRVNAQGNGRVHVWSLIVLGDQGSIPRTCGIYVEAGEKNDQKNMQENRYKRLKVRVAAYISSGY